LNSVSTANHAHATATNVLIPMIRVAATIGFAIAPCSLGFVIIAVSEQLIRSIMIGDDPETLVSDLQRQFPNESLAVDECCDQGLVSQVISLIEDPAHAVESFTKNTLLAYKFCTIVSSFSDARQ
jgi:hypothetical protein